MALTEAQQSQAREVLGWSARFHEQDRSLENAFAAIADLPADETRVIALLAEFTDLDERLADARNRLKASAVGSITLNAAEIAGLKSEGKRLARTLAATLGVALKACKYGGGASSGGGYIENA